MRGKTDLGNREYDKWLAENGKQRELRDRKTERQKASRNYSGWHFGIDQKPVYTKDKEEFRRELDKRGLAIEDDIKNRKVIDRGDMVREFRDEKKRR